MRTIDLARMVGLSTQAVRGYESLGLLPPAARSPSGYRRFTERHVAALQTARALIGAGYSWQTAREMLQAVHRGDVNAALTEVDRRHAAIDRGRQRIDAAVDAIQILISRAPASRMRPRQRGAVHIKAAAQLVGVRPSALRFWEQQGLLEPGRAAQSGYRMYDHTQLRRVEVIALLRSADYGFDAIRAVLADLVDGGQEAAMHTVAQRRTDIADASQACTAATAALWDYIRHGAASDVEAGE